MSRHTVIVGAGITGLWLADKLTAAGDRVTLVERNDYVGGRIYTRLRKDGEQYELGAGRIHTQHRLINELIDRYHLTRIPLAPTLEWKTDGYSPSLPNHFDPTWSAIATQIARLPPTVLATHTPHQLAIRFLGAAAAERLLDRFPYRAETERMRADVALRAFMPGGEMASHDDYFVLKEGLTTVLQGLVKDLRRSRRMKILVSTTVADVRRHADGHYAVILKGPHPALHADRVILTVPVTALRQLPVLRDAAPLRHLGMSPLTRIYARYPASKEAPAWFAGLPATVTAGPLRYVIPINPITGIIMISYTDDRDTVRWHGLKGPALADAIQKETQKLFPLRPILPPLWVRPYEWETGTTYWRPGTYDPAAVSRQILQPRPSTMPGLFCAGESFSVGRQAWIEGALEHAQLLWETHLKE
jgi:predicted NAD/FAD-dependent oxidoreductase